MSVLFHSDVFEAKTNHAMNRLDEVSASALDIMQSRVCGGRVMQHEDTLPTHSETNTSVKCLKVNVGHNKTSTDSQSITCWP